jgi:hypothetical protein
VQTTREIYLDACAEIGCALAYRGFKYAKSGPHAKRSQADFTFAIHFQSSVCNSAGSNIALWIHANVRSKRLCSWRAAQPHALRRDDWVAGGQIGNLRTPHQWLDINLADTASRPATVASAISAIVEFGLPLFSAFEDVPGLCERIITTDVPGMDIPLALEFLLCFGTTSATDATLHRFFTARPDLLSQYHTELDRFRSTGLPKIVPNGYAPQLAFATVAYGLKSPGIA